MSRGVFVRTKETRAKMSLAKMGHTTSEETRAKLSRALKLHWQAPAERVKKSQAMRERYEDPTERAKQSRALRKCYEDPAERLKQSRRMMGKNLGKHHTVETREKNRVAHLVLWQNPAYRDKVVKASLLALRIHPNKPETALLALLENTYPGEWAFVGDGQLIIAGKCPDFVNINGKKLIVEVFGDWWHKGENPQDRIDIFKQYGYDTLVIWEKELKQPEKVLDKIKSFA